MTTSPTSGDSSAQFPAPLTEFPPTLREVLVRPRWIGLLLVCLVVAGVFAWLGQWQLGRAIAVDPTPPGATEEVRPLSDVLQPGQYLPQPLGGQMVSVTGAWIPGDFIVVSSRFNDGVEGYWVTGQFRVDSAPAPSSVAVALGWAPTRTAADAAASALSVHAENDPLAQFELTGRVISDEGPAIPPPGADPMELTRMSPAALLSRWHDTEDLAVYRPYLASTAPLGDLAAISSKAPLAGSGVNWLNIFYAVEWAVFAGFAFYLWYRLAKDAWERELEELDDAVAS